MRDIEINGYRTGFNWQDLWDNDHFISPSLRTFLWYISITVFISFYFSRALLIYSSILIIFWDLRLKSTTNSWLFTISVYCFASWIYKRRRSQFYLMVLISLLWAWIVESRPSTVDFRLPLIFSTKTNFSRVCVNIWTIVVVFFFNLWRSSFLSSIFSFKVWFYIFNCSKSIRWSPSANYSFFFNIFWFFAKVFLALKISSLRFWSYYVIFASLSSHS